MHCLCHVDATSLNKAAHAREGVFMLKILRLIAITSLLLVLAACGHNANPETEPNILGMGSFTIDTSTGITTASLSDSFISINGGIELVNVINCQFRFATAANIATGSGRVVITRVVIRNRSGGDIKNLVL